MRHARAAGDVETVPANLNARCVSESIDLCVPLFCESLGVHLVHKAIHTPISKGPWQLVARIALQDDQPRVDRSQVLIEIAKRLRWV